MESVAFVELGEEVNNIFSPESSVAAMVDAVGRGGGDDHSQGR